MKITKDISDRIQFLRFPLVVAIVFIHSGAIFLSAEDQFSQHYSFSVKFIIYLISGIFARVAVPLFFIISGFLFYRNFDFTFKNYILKIETRIMTLFVPYLFWNISLLIFLLILQSIPFLSPFFSGRTGSIALYNIRADLRVRHPQPVWGLHRDCEERGTVL
jgi:surface polysaccharide O-acyltransferase-like enzyme